MDHLLVTCNQRCKGLGVAVPTLAYPSFFFVQLAHATFLTDMTAREEQSFEDSLLIGPLHRLHSVPPRPSPQGRGRIVRRFSELQCTRFAVLAPRNSLSMHAVPSPRGRGSGETN